MKASLLVVTAACLLAGCGGARSPVATPTDSMPATTFALSPSPTPLPSATPAVVAVAYRVEVRARGVGDFPRIVDATLRDPRGWMRADFRLVRQSDARYLVVIAESREVDRLCRPYDTFGKYSCQNGPVVAINADRWRYATPEWTGDLATYRQMLVNHEVGHLLGQHHPPKPQCPKRGQPAAVMAQQSTELNGCLPSPWPLPSEIARAARHDLPLAPPYQRN